MTPEDRLKNVRESQDYFSGKISELARNIGFGLVAVSFALLTSDAVFAKAILVESKDDLALAAFVGCIIVLLDYAQLLFGWWSAGRAAANKKGEYNRAGLSKVFRFLQFLAFYGKQVFAVWGAWILTISTWKAAGSPWPSWLWQ
jgi:hypothetical protein